MESVLPPSSTPFGGRLRLRLETETVIWMTTVGLDGTPQPNPVWFLWDGESILVYNRSDAARVSHIRARPRVAMHFDSNGGGGDIAVITGHAEIDSDAPPADEDQAYAKKYGAEIARIGHEAATFATAYPVAIRIHPTKVRGF